MAAGRRARGLVDRAGAVVDADQVAENGLAGSGSEEDRESTLTEGRPGPVGEEAAGCDLQAIDAVGVQAIAAETLETAVVDAEVRAIDQDEPVALAITCADEAQAADHGMTSGKVQGVPGRRAEDGTGTGFGADAGRASGLAGNDDAGQGPVVATAMMDAGTEDQGFVRPQDGHGLGQGHPGVGIDADGAFARAPGAGQAGLAGDHLRSGEAHGSAVDAQEGTHGIAGKTETRAHDRGLAVGRGHDQRRPGRAGRHVGLQPAGAEGQPAAIVAVDTPAGTAQGEMGSVGEGQVTVAAGFDADLGGEAGSRWLPFRWHPPQADADRQHRCGSRQQWPDPDRGTRVPTATDAAGMGDMAPTAGDAARGGELLAQMAAQGDLGPPAPAGLGVVAEAGDQAGFDPRIRGPVEDGRDVLVEIIHDRPWRGWPGCIGAGCCAPVTGRH